MTTTGYPASDLNTPGPAPVPATNGLAVASMILGITGIVICLAGIGTFAQVALAIIFGAISLQRASHGAPYKGYAIAGLSLGIVGFLVYFVIGVASHGVFFLV